MTDEILRRVYRAPATDNPRIAAQRKPYLSHLIARHFPPARDARIVDLGCGTGLLLHLARDHGYTDLQGFDIAAEQLAPGRADIDRADAQSALASLADASVDLLISFDLLEHLEREALPSITDEARRVLRSGGVWLIHAPNGVSPFAGRVRYGDLTHRQAFTPQALRHWLESSGFTNVECVEEAPIVHGLKSALRRLAWTGVRAIYRLLIAIETGETGPQVIVSQNFLTRARK